MFYKTSLGTAILTQSHLLMASLGTVAGHGGRNQNKFVMCLKVPLIVLQAPLPYK